jgi:putative hemolysin
MLILLLLSAFFSLSEMAFASVGKVKLKTLIDQGVKGSKKALWIVDNFDKTLTTLLVGNNLVNIGLTSVSVLFFAGLFESIPNSDTWITIVNTISVTIIVLIFGEILPKSIAKTNPDRICIGISGLLYFLIKIMMPITYPFRLLNRRVLRKVENEIPFTVTEDELETIIDTMEEEGSIDEEEADMLQKVLDLSDITVEEIMTPRVDMVACEVNDDVGKIRDVFFKNKFSRIPIYDEKTDNIIGILSERDFYTKLIKGQTINIKKLLRKPIFVPTSTKVDSLIELLQRENSHLAIVVDEYGGVDGLVTMEDALEELVGEIYDEHDDVTEKIVADGDTYLVDAEMALSELFDDLNLGELPESDSTSVGGWLFEMFQDIPEVGEKFQYEVAVNQVYDELSELVSEDLEVLTFEVLKVKKRRIKLVRLTVSIQAYEKAINGS